MEAFALGWEGLTLAWKGYTLGWEGLTDTWAVLALAWEPILAAGMGGNGESTAAKVASGGRSAITIADQRAAMAARQTSVVASGSAASSFLIAEAAMAITTIGSYLTTLDEFITHWNNVNTELGGAPEIDLTLKGGYTRDEMIAHRAVLQGAITDLVDKENDRQTQRSNTARPSARRIAAG